MEEGDLLVGMDGEFNAILWKGGKALLNQRVCRILTTNETTKKYIYWVFRSSLKQIEDNTYAVTVKHISSKQIASIEVPLPPLEIQQELVDEIESYKKVIDGARLVVENYKPIIPTDPYWPIVRLGDMCDINLRTIDPRSVFGETEFTYVDISSVENGTGKVSYDKKLRGNEAPSRARRLADKGDILWSTVRPNLKAFAYLDFIPDKAVFSTGFAVITPKKGVVGKFLYFQSLSDYLQNQMISRMGRGSYPSINQEDVKDLNILLPPIDVQQKIVEEIDVTQKLVSANYELIHRMEHKIQMCVQRVWEHQ